MNIKQVRQKIIELSSELIEIANNDNYIEQFNNKINEIRRLKEIADKLEYNNVKCS